MALIKKLNYMVTRKTEGSDMLEAGGVLNGYQLSTIPDSVKNIGYQCGVIFYIPPAFTSKIDPTTGFIDAFNYTNLKNKETRKEFFSKFEDIFYNQERNCFGFCFDYAKFDVYQTMARTRWTVFSCENESGSKHVYDTIIRKNVKINTTEKIQELMKANQVGYMSGNLHEQILDIPADKEHAKFWGDLLYYFKIIMKLRDSNSSTDAEPVDRIVSPVLNKEQKFFITPDCPGPEHRYDALPMDADTNGAYHIALKGLYLVEEKIKKTNLEERIPKDFYKIPNAEWFAYVQEKRNG
jgi:CRISPR-associated protein Cpf1